MVGLDRTISQIKGESRKAAERTRIETRSKADEVLAQARTDAQRECADVGRRSKQAAANILERGCTTAELKKRGVVLAEKQRFIDATIGMAKVKFKGFETGAYFDVILKLTVKSVQLGGGELLLPKKGLRRLPEGLEDGLSASLKDKGVVLHISGDTWDIDGGFALTYGGTEGSCSIDALFDAAHEVLRDKV